MLHKGNIHNHKKTPGMFRHSLSNFLQYGTNNRNNNADSLLGGVDFSGARVHAWPNHSIKIGSISGAVFAGSVATLLADGSNDNSSTITMQDLAVALVLAHFGSDPAFSLDPWEPTNPDGPWLRCVYYPEHSDDRQDIPMHKRLPFSFSQTAYGRTMFEADWLLKQLSMGVNLDQQNAAGPFPSPLPVRTFPAALLNLGLCDRFGLENRQTSPNSDNSPRYTRLWIIVDQEQTQEGVVAAHETCPIPIVSYSEQNDMGSSIAFRFSDVKLSVQVMRMTRGTTGQLEDLSDPRLVEPTCSEVVFARLMSTHYDEVARHYPALRRLKELAKLQAVAKWMIENDVEVDLSAALTHIQETSLTALEKVPALERKNSNARIYGGVNLSVRQGYHDRASPCCTLEKNAQIELKNMIRTSMITMASNNSFDLRTSVTTTTSPMVIPLPFIKKKQCCVCARPLDFTSLFKPSSASSDAAFCDEHHPDACFGCMLPLYIDPTTRKLFSNGLYNFVSVPISTELKSDCCRYHPACFMCAVCNKPIDNQSFRMDSNIWHVYYHPQCYSPIESLIQGNKEVRHGIRNPNIDVSDKEQVLLKQALAESRQMYEICQQQQPSQTKKQNEWEEDDEFVRALSLSTFEAQKTLPFVQKISKNNDHIQTHRLSPVSISEDDKQLAEALRLSMIAPSTSEDDELAQACRLSLATLAECTSSLDSPMPSKESLLCPICGNKFNKEIDLQEHVQLHLDN
ncbi:unnamed protein product [Adineta steineri]|uniref:C2H2-type domain-containing protein n=1 Tax=Adineta steineri TaxID=433720 RepID=A0A813MT82_9BILA|nr:unnamed protein product [Adineta steineri]